MTSNQTKAILLAHQIAQGQIAGGDLSDHDWMLLVLAAGLSCTAVSPAVVSSRVLRNACAQAGYFNAAGRGLVGRHTSHA
jgi:hypothetical protein